MFNFIARTSPLSILNGRARSALQVRATPFPHLVLEEALPEDLYASLEAHYPREDLIRAAKQVAYRDQLMARDILENNEIHAVWREFTRYHVSSAFYLELLNVFAFWIRKTYPWLEAEQGKALESFSVGLRDPAAAHLPDVCLDCQPGLNTVTLTPATPRTAHLDASNKLMTGLLYMRHPEDNARGGDFLIYRFKSSSPRFETATTIDPGNLEVACTVPYRRNCAVFFMNSPRSVHGVSLREGTKIPRRLVNFIAGCYTLKRKEFFPSPPPPDVLANTRFG